MNLSECPGCGLPRESTVDSAKPCPLCGWDPSKPVPTHEPEPAPKAKVERAPTPAEPEPKPQSTGRAMLLLTLAVLVLVAGVGAVLFWPKSDPPKDDTDTAKN